MKNLLICVISSEKTWQNFPKHNFDKKILLKRENFDFAVVLNGYSGDAVNFYKQFLPDYFFLRPNLGFDVAAISHLLSIIPIYKTTIIMHDDHRFSGDDWLDKIVSYRNSHPEVDIWGNILYQQTGGEYIKYLKKIGQEKFIEHRNNFFLHGLSGVFNQKAIQSLKNYGLQILYSENKEEAIHGERLFSEILILLNIKIEQFPDGIYKFFKHGEGNYKNYLFSTASMYAYTSRFKEAKEYFYKYLAYCKQHNYTKDYPLLLSNMAYVHYALGEYEEAKQLWRLCKQMFPGLPLPIEAEKIL